MMREPSFSILKKPQPMKLAGRRVLVRDLLGLGPGANRIDLAEARSWTSGIYFARLTQGTRSARAKWCVLK